MLSQVEIYVTVITPAVKSFEIKYPVLNYGICVAKCPGKDVDALTCSDSSNCPKQANLYATVNVVRYCMPRDI